MNGFDFVRSSRRQFVVAVALAALQGSIVSGQETVAVQSRYEKREVLVPMRDGTRLFTSIYIPRDTTQRYPIMLTRTPYSVRPYGEQQHKSNLGPSALFGQSGYIFAYQDVRGRWASEGDFVNMRPHRSLKHGANDIDESTDTYDTIDWLVKNVRNNNGRVGMWVSRHCIWRLQRANMADTCMLLR